MSSDPRADHDSAGAGGGSGSGGGDQDRGGPREQKKAMRKRIKSELKAISEEAAGAAAAAVAERLLAFPQLEKKSGGGGGASVYLSMPGELGTAAVVGGLFKLGWKVYIPKVRVDQTAPREQVAYPCILIKPTKPTAVVYFVRRIDMIPPSRWRTGDALCTKKWICHLELFGGYCLWP